MSVERREERKNREREGFGRKGRNGEICEVVFVGNVIKFYFFLFYL